MAVMLICLPPSRFASRISIFKFDENGICSLRFKTTLIGGSCSGTRATSFTSPIHATELRLTHPSTARELRWTSHPPGSLAQADGAASSTRDIISS